MNDILEEAKKAQKNNPHMGVPLYPFIESIIRKKYGKDMEEVFDAYKYSIREEATEKAREAFAKNIERTLKNAAEIAIWDIRIKEESCKTKKHSGD